MSDQHQQTIDTCAIMELAPLVEVRGASGKLYGRLNPQTMIMEFRHGRSIERVDLSVYQQTPRLKKHGR